MKIPTLEWRRTTPSEKFLLVVLWLLILLSLVQSYDLLQAYKEISRNSTVRRINP